MQIRFTKMVLFLAIFLFVTFYTFPQEIKIAVVNSGRILEESIPGKEVVAQLKNFSEQKQKEINTKSQELQRLRDRLATQRFSLSPDAQEKLANEIEQKDTALKRLMEDAQRDFDSLQAKLFTKIQNEVTPIISNLGKEKGYAIVFDLRGLPIIYYDEKIDITDEVIKRYNQSKAPAPKQQSQEKK
ncbi:MAG: OmpH family outer membrane protein [Acidobacteriota bacterium]